MRQTQKNQPHPNSLKSSQELAYEFLQDVTDRAIDGQIRMAALRNRN